MSITHQFLSQFFLFAVEGLMQSMIHFRGGLSRLAIKQYCTMKVVSIQPR